VFAGILGFFYISKFRIKNVTIEGLDSIEEKDLSDAVNKTLSEKVAGFLPGDNIFLINKKRFSEKIMPQFLRIGDIEIVRKFPDALTLSVRERSPWATVCTNMPDKCFLAGEDGFLFDFALNLQGNLILKVLDEREREISLGEFIMESDEFEKLKKFKEDVEDYIDSRIIKIVLKNNESYELHFNSWYIIIDKENDIQLASSNLMLALYSEIKDNYENLEYVDLRFGNKVFYRFKE